MLTTILYKGKKYYVAGQINGVNPDLIERLFTEGSDTQKLIKAFIPEIEFVKDIGL